MKNLNGVHGWAPWKWLFLIEGSIPLGIGCLIPLLLPAFPSTVKWGWSKEERRILVRREQNNYTSIAHEKFEFRKIGRCLLELKFWLFAFMYAANHFCLSSLTFFLPSIIEVRNPMVGYRTEADR